MQTEDNIPKLIRAHLFGFLSGILNNIVAAIMIAIISLPVLVSWATGTLNILFQTVKSTTPLWATISLCLLFTVYIAYKKPRRELPSDNSFNPAFGVFWDERLDIRCRSCGTPLKNSSHGPSVFFCADPRCNSKHILRDDSGNELTKQQAMDLLKPANKANLADAKSLAAD